MTGVVLAWCTEHGDYFVTRAGSVSEAEELCTRCAIRLWEQEKKARG